MYENKTEPAVLSVSDLNRCVKQLLENHFKLIWIEGEISSLTKPQSGHIYFTLKDAQAQVRCALFRTRYTTIPFNIDNGQQVLALARISLYEGRGDYQLIIEHLEERGEGLLRRRFEQLKNQLATEGLFLTAHKKTLPTFPRCIGVITSPTGAAIKDVLVVLKRRFASIPVIIYPTAVQGDKAINQIVAALTLANVRKECDVLLICRGGGSLEDLWAFNEEKVARAIFKSVIPTLCAVGHEIDFSIADFVADKRAPTPSAAAELLSPNKTELIKQLSLLSNRLVHLMQTLFIHQTLNLQHSRSRLIHPGYLLKNYQQDLLQIKQSLYRTYLANLANKKKQLQLANVRLDHQNPLALLQTSVDSLLGKNKFLIHYMQFKLKECKQKLNSASRALNTVSPLSTLDRGYSITTKQNHVVEHVNTICPGDEVKVQVRTGYLFCKVEKIEEK